MKFLIELYGFPLRSTDLTISVNHSKVWEASPVKGEPSPPCPGHELRQLLLLASLTPSHEAEGQPRNYVEHPSCKGKPVECTLPKLKTNP